MAHPTPALAPSDNPFERYDLDPREGIVAITQRLKELAEDAMDDAARERIRAAWEELTLHPARRLRAALDAHPETRSPLGSPPSHPRPRNSTTRLELRDLAARPSTVASLPASITSGTPRPSMTAPTSAVAIVPAPASDVDAPPLDGDPHF